MSAELEGLVSVSVGGHTFEVPVMCVQDVIAAVRIDTVPLAPPEIAGALNLRGRIVTAVDMRRRLGLAPRESGEPHMSAIVERGGELFALQVDDVGDVLWLDDDTREPCPPNLDAGWRSLCDGLHRLPDALLLVLRIGPVLTLEHTRPLAA